jgi:hypothetical protein
MRHIKRALFRRIAEGAESEENAELRGGSGSGLL